MRFRVVASVSGILSVVFGLAMMVVPAAIASAYGDTITAREGFIVRLLGASYFGYGVLAWAGAAFADRAGRRVIAATQAVSWALGVPISLSAVLAGLTNPMGWSVVALQVVVPLAWVASVVDSVPADEAPAA